MSLLQISAQTADTLSTVSEHVGKVVAEGDGLEKLSAITQQLIDGAFTVGGSILKAALVYVIGKFLISLLKKFISKMLDKRNVDINIKTFVKSLVNITLTILLIISVVGALGVETASFAALLASAGVAIGMALSGNLQNFAGGLVILLFKPYKVGDWIVVIYVPNASLSSGVVTNYSAETKRRVDWVIGVEYGEDYEKVKAVVSELIAADKRILKDPEPFIALNALDASSVNIVIRAWVSPADYWGVYFDMNKNVYATFNEKGIGFPFPQLTVHQAAK